MIGIDEIATRVAEKHGYKKGIVVFAVKHFCKSVDEVIKSMSCQGILINEVFKIKIRTYQLEKLIMHYVNVLRKKEYKLDRSWYENKIRLMWNFRRKLKNQNYKG